MKITLEQQKKGAELMKALVEKAWENAAFKDQLLNNPEQALQQLTGKNIPVPENVKIIAEDQSNENIIYFNIPAEPNFDELELTEEQLELIAGGLTPALYFGGMAVGIGISWAVSHL